MKSSFLLTGLALGAALSAVASTVVPAPHQQHPVLLVHGTVYTVSGGVLENTDVLLDAGHISKIGRALTAPTGTEVVDVTGRRIYPGLIAADTFLGLAEIDAVRATVDTTETGPINPNTRAQVAINPDSELLPVARSNGVLTALVVPSASPDLIAGLSALIRLDGWTWEDLTLRPAVALHVYWPDMVLNRELRAPKSPADQQKDIAERLRLLDDSFNTARAYAQARASGVTVVDTRWEAMRPVFSGELPVFVHATEFKQIAAALAWAKHQKLKITIVGGVDAPLLAIELKAADVPVILTGVHTLPLRRDDAFDAPFTGPAKLQAAGVRFCIAGDTEGEGDTHANERNVPYLAAQAAACGLAPAEALKAVTLHAAELLGVGAELGSVETGKRATLIVTDGDPLEIPTQVKMAFIDGARIDLKNRQTELYDKYRKRYGK